LTPLSGTLSPTWHMMDDDKLISFNFVLSPPQRATPKYHDTSKSHKLPI
jgi:hypothetical protein